MRVTTLEGAMLSDVSGAYSAISNVNKCSPVILDEKLTNYGKKHTELNFSGWMRKALRDNVRKVPKNPCDGILENVPDVKQPH